MADKGIIFSAAMVRALLDGRKTQTRRLLKPAPPEWCANDRPGYSALTPKGHIEFRGRWPGSETEKSGYGSKFIKLPYASGDRLYVREAHAIDGARSWYRLGHEEALARGPRVDVRWRPSIHMPRWASRLWLEVTEVRVQRLQDISEEDARAEGIKRIDDPRGTAWKSYETCPDGTPHPHASVPNRTAKISFAELWNSLHTTEGERWEDNPWIVAVSFSVHRGNIDEVAG